MYFYNEKTNNNFLCPHQVYDDPRFQKLSLASKYLYTILCKIANRDSEPDGWFHQSILQLSKLSNLNKKTVIKAKKTLKEEGWININAGYYQHSKKRTYDYFQLNGFKFRVNKD